MKSDGVGEGGEEEGREGGVGIAVLVGGKEGAHVRLRSVKGRSVSPGVV